MSKKWYPIGSVVRLKHGTKRIMICGHLKQSRTADKIFDYCACYYPEGIIDDSELFLFQEEEIAELYYSGYTNPEEEFFRECIQEVYENHNNKAFKI